MPSFSCEGRARRSDAQTRVARLALALALGAFVVPALGQSAPDAPKADGRFSMTPAGEGFLRLDTRTGAVSHCLVTPAGAQCRAGADERAALEAEIDRLTKDNADLRGKLAAAGDQTPGGRPRNALPSQEEMDRAIDKLGARGVQICTSVNGRALDEPEYFPVFERVTNKHDLPIFMHPARPATRADYANEPKSKYEIWQVLGWPFETSVAMSRMVFSGFFEKLPNMRLITHHCGAMIPFLAGRAETLWAQLGARSADENYDELLKNMKKAPIEYFKMFYADTVLGGSSSALRCGLDFFGADKVVFASDCPFDPEGGPMFIREGVRSVEDLNLSEDDKRKIYFGNALKLLKMKAPQ